MKLFQKKSKYDDLIAQCDADHKRLDELRAQVAKLTPQWESLQDQCEAAWLSMTAANAMSATIDPSTARKFERVAAHAEKLKLELAELESKRDALLVPIDTEIHDLQRRIVERNSAFISGVGRWVRKIKTLGLDSELAKMLDASVAKLGTMTSGYFRDLVEEASRIAQQLEASDFGLSLDSAIDAKRKPLGDDGPPMLEERTDVIATFRPPTKGQESIL